MGDCLCNHCSALCCRYFAFPIDNPTSAKMFDDMRWYLCHENVVIFIEEKQWYMGVMNRCRHLEPDNRCGIYETRPNVCRGYDTDNCDYHGGEYNFERLFTSAEELRKYGEAQVEKWKLDKKRKKIRAKKRQRVTAHLSAGRKLLSLGAMSPKAPPVNGKGIRLPILQGT